MNQDFWQLRTAGRNYYDAYRLETRISNRLRALARERKAYDIDLHAQKEAVSAMKDAEQKILVRMYRILAPEPLRTFQKETLGIGEVWMARLLGEVGDMKVYTEAWWEDLPSSGGDEDDDADDLTLDLLRENAARPKRVLAIGEVKTTGVRELWAYCGHGDASLKRRRGQDQEEALASGNPAAKMIVHQMSEFLLRSNGVPDKNGKPRGMTPYYWYYVASRAHAEELHPDWKPGHVYSHAVRLVGKAALKDFWRVQHGEKPVYGARTEWHPRARHTDIGQPLARQGASA